MPINTVIAQLWWIFPNLELVLIIMKEDEFEAANFRTYKTNFNSPAQLHSSLLRRAKFLIIYLRVLRMACFNLKRRPRYVHKSSRIEIKWEI